MAGVVVGVVDDCGDGAWGGVGDGHVDGDLVHVLVAEGLEVEGVVWLPSVDHVMDWERAEYVYVQLADDLGKRIERGKLLPGAWLLSEAELAQEYGTR
jgi:hypothetical protein